MSIEIYSWKKMIELSLEDKNELLRKLEDKNALNHTEEQFLDLLVEHLEDEFWKYQNCHTYFYKDARDLRYDPSRCDECIKDDVTVFGIRYDKAEPETRKWMKDVFNKERQIDKGLGYYGF